MKLIVFLSSIHYILLYIVHMEILYLVLFRFDRIHTHMQASDKIITVAIGKLWPFNWRIEEKSNENYIVYVVGDIFCLVFLLVFVHSVYFGISFRSFGKLLRVRANWEWIPMCKRRMDYEYFPPREERATIIFTRVSMGTKHFIKRAVLCTRWN